MNQIISTIGYEGATLGEFVTFLGDHGIRHVLDVRDRPLSRKPGFSKGCLSHTLADVSIGYTHLRSLGDPKPGRDAMRAGRLDEFERIFTAHLDRPEAKCGLQEAIRLVRHTPTVLLCFEADHRGCHRHIVAERMSLASSLAVRHLALRCTAVSRGRKRDAGAFAFG